MFLLLCQRHSSSCVWQRELLSDSVQNMEFTITTPLLFATMLVALSPAVPTAMVQWSFACLLGSHLLCIPVLYLSHMSIDLKKRGGDWSSYVSGALTQGVLVLLIACAVFQLVGLSIHSIYYMRAIEFYDVSNLLRAAFGCLLFAQSLFVLVVVINAMMSVVIVNYNYDAEPYKKAVEIFSWMYIALNIFVKGVVVTIITLASVNQEFPVLSCDAWQGDFAFMW